MIANGRRRFSPTPPAEHDRQHRQDARRNRRDQPRHEREDDREDHRWLFGRGSLLGCYGFVGLRGAPVRCRSGVAPPWTACAHAVGLLLPPAAPTAARVRLRRGQVVGEGGRDLADRAEALAGGLEVVVGARRVAVGGGEQRGGGSDRQLPGGVASLTAFSSWRWPREFASAPSSRFASGYSALALRSSTLRTARASRHVQRARIWSGASGLPSPIARSSTRTPWTRSFSHGGACVTRVTRSSKLIRSTGIETRSESAISRSRRFGFSAAQVKRNCSSAALLARALSFSTSADAVVEAGLAAGDARPEALLLLVEVARVDALPLALDHGEAPVDVGRDRDEPRRGREPAARPPLHAAARRRRDAGALAVEVGAEQRVQRDHAVVVGRALLDEVDDDARLLARVQAHDPADPLLVDALGWPSGRGA